MHHALSGKEGLREPRPHTGLGGEHVKAAGAWDLLQTDGTCISGGETRALVCLKSTTRSHVQPVWGTAALATTYPAPSRSRWETEAREGKGLLKAP